MDEPNTREQLTEQLTQESSNLEKAKLEVKRIQFVIQEIKFKISQCPKPNSNNSNKSNNKSDPNKPNPYGDTGQTMGRPRMNPKELAPTTRALYASLEKKEQKQQIIAKTNCQKYKEFFGNKDEREGTALLNYMKDHTLEESIHFFTHDLFSGNLPLRKQQTNNAILLGYEVPGKETAESIEEWFTNAVYLDQVAAYYESLLGIKIPMFETIERQDFTTTKAFIQSTPERKSAPLSEHDAEARDLPLHRRVTYYAMMGRPNPDDKYN